MQENIEYMMDWLHRRKITDTVITDFNLHVGTHPILGECIVIPVFAEDGTFLFNKYRRNPIQDEKPKYVYDIGGKMALYGWHKAKDHKQILITEGELDSLVAWSANIPAVSSTGGAESFRPEWGELLKDKEVVLCFDNDQAGAKGMVKVLSLIPHARVVFVPHQHDVKDISDYVAKGGDIHTLIHTAQAFTSLESVRADRAHRLATWLPVLFHDAYIETHTIPEYVTHKKKLSKDSPKILRAKEVPIPTLLKLNRAGKIPCIWHNEKTPSLHYFKKNNRVFCFGCGKSGDAIDVYMTVHNVSFTEAIEKMV